MKNFIEITNILLPVATLLIGFILAGWREDRKEKRKVNNLKKILRYEILENHKQIVCALSPNTSVQLKASSIGIYTRKLSNSMLKEHLDSINLLSEDELSSILFAYEEASSLKSLISDSNKREKNTDEKFDKMEKEIINDCLREYVEALERSYYLLGGKKQSIAESRKHGASIAEVLFDIESA